MIEYISFKIKEEKDFMARKKDEVTVDFEVIKSELRLEAFQEVKRELERRGNET